MPTQEGKEIIKAWVSEYVPCSQFHFLKIDFIFKSNLFIYFDSSVSLLRAGFLEVQSAGSGRMGFESCSTGALLLHGVWDLPRSGVELVSPALAGRLLSTYR